MKETTVSHTERGYDSNEHANIIHDLLISLQLLLDLRVCN